MSSKIISSLLSQEASIENNLSRILLIINLKEVSSESLLPLNELENEMAINCPEASSQLNFFSFLYFNCFQWIKALPVLLKLLQY